MVEVLANGAASTLAGGINNSQTTITIASADVGEFPVAGEYRLAVTDNTHTELMRVTAGQGTSTLTVSRAVEPYAGAQTAYAFASGSTVAQVLTRDGLTAMLGTGGGGGPQVGDKLLLNYTSAADIWNGFSLAASTWTNFDSSKTFVVDDANSTVEVIASGSAFVRNAASGSGVAFRVQVDGTTNYLMGGSSDQGTTPGASFLSGLGPLALTGLSVGSHTLQFQVLTNSGSGGTGYCRASLPGEFFAVRVWQRHLQSAPGPAYANGAKLLLDWAATTDINNAAISATTWTDTFAAQSFRVDDPTAIVVIEVGGVLRVGGTTGADQASRIVVDSTNYLIGGGFFAASSFTNTLQGTQSVPITGLSIGQHTVKVQVYTVLAGNIFCRAATNPNTENLRIRVFQVPQAQTTPVGGTAGDKLLLNYAANTDLATGLSVPVTTWTDIGTNQTFVVDDASATVEILVGGNISVGNAATRIGARILIDSTTGYGLGGDLGASGSGVFNNALSGSVPIAISGLATGSHTVKVQVWSQDASGSAYCRPGTLPNVEFLTIRVWQRPTIYRGGSVPSAQVRKTSNQSLANATWTAVTWDSEAFDTDSIHDTSTNTSRLTCRTPGKYLLSGVVEFSGLTNPTYLSLQFALNGNTSGRVYGRQGRTDTTVTPIVSIADVIDLSVGDYVELYVFTGTGTGTIVGTNPNASFSMTRIGDVALGGPIKYTEVGPLTANQASVTLPVSGSLPQNYRHIRVIATTRSNSSTSGQMYWQANADTTAANYAVQRVGMSLAGGTNLPSDNARVCGFIAGGDAPNAAVFNVSEIRIFNYADTDKWKVLHSDSDTFITTARYFQNYRGWWQSTAAITSLTFVHEAGSSFVAGSIFTLYLEP